MKRTTRTIAIVVLVGLATIAGLAQTALSTRPLPKSSNLYIKAEPDFAIALSAAFKRKQVPVSILTDEKDAAFTLQSAAVSAKQESGVSKLARCAFAYCVGIEGTSTVSVELINNRTHEVVWAYQVRKSRGGPAGIQSMSEAIAKHYKHDAEEGRF